jgi:hypothetical protein
VDVTFDALDAFAFVVIAVILLVAVVIIVALGKLPGQLARKWGHPQAAAVNVAGWLGIATGGVIWPLALIWAFIVPSGSASPTVKEDHANQTIAPAVPSGQERRP